MKPPFQFTPKIIESLTELSYLLGQTHTRGMIVPSPKLRKENHIRTVHSTLAIEGNTFTEQQVTDLIDGKKVFGAASEILEVKNTVKLYQKLDSYTYSSVKDFLSAHKVLMKDLLISAGEFRTKNVGVLKGKRVVHAAPQPKMVRALIDTHFKWLKKDKEVNQILKSCVSHYEIEFIHPFIDGNGRIGRFWQTLILKEVDPIFKFIPMESIIHEKQELYYKALEGSDRSGESTVFIEFMLEVLIEALNDLTSQFPTVVNKVENRFEIAKEKFKDKPFSRKDYIDAVPEISTATASRDLLKWISEGLLSKKGERNQTRYYFK